jgi:hypothetical protein
MQRILCALAMIVITALPVTAAEQSGLTTTIFPFFSKTMNYDKAEVLPEPRHPEIVIGSKKWIERGTIPDPAGFAGGSPLIADQDNLFWAAQFTGSLVVPEDGAYVFQIRADEYAALTIRGAVVINQYGERAGLTAQSTPVSLRADQPVPVLVEFWNVLGPSLLQMSWQTPGSDAFVPIPHEAFRPTMPVSPHMVTAIRFQPAPDQAEAMVGGVFAGSLTSPTNDFETFASIEQAPQAGQWNELPVSEPKAYRYVKYIGPAGSHGVIAELRFQHDGTALEGAGFGTAGDGEQGDAVWQQAFDEDTSTAFRGMDPDHQYVGIDLGPGSQVPQPSISRLETASEAQTFVQITVPENAFVRYTLSPDKKYQQQDPPSALHGTLYTQPFAIAQDRSIMAQAYDLWRAPSQQAVAEISVQAIDVREGLTTVHTGNSLMGGLFDFIPTIARSAGIEAEMKGFGMAGAPTDLIWKNQNRGDASRAWIAEQQPDVYIPQPFSRNPREESYWESVYFRYVLEHNPQARLMIYMQWPKDSRYQEGSVHLLRLTQAPTPLEGDSWEVDLRDYLSPEETATITDDSSVVGWRGESALFPKPANWREDLVNYLREMEILYQIMDQQFPDQHVSVIPVGAVLGRLYDAIIAGEMPGVDPAVGNEFFFADGLHLNPTGQYISALTHFACIYNQDPTGAVTSAGSGMTPEQAQEVQRLAWETIQAYPYSIQNLD